jgi:hypothetical protein
MTELKADAKHGTGTLFHGGNETNEAWKKRIGNRESF